MSNQLFPIKQHELIDTAFNNKIFGINDTETEVHFKNGENYVKIKTNPHLAEVLYHFEKNLSIINENLNKKYIKYKKDLHCIVYSKNPLTEVSMNNETDQKKMLWFIFAKTSVIIQLSIELRNELRTFADDNKFEFYKYYNLNEAILNSLLNGINNPNRQRINKINLWKENRRDHFINFHHVNTQPLPLIFEFIKGLNFIRQTI